MRSRATLLAVVATIGLSIAASITPGVPAGAAFSPSGGFAQDVQLPVDPQSDPERTRARADEIVTGPEYQEPGNAGESPFTRLRRWISDRIPDFDGPDGPDADFDALGVVVIVIVIVGALAVVAYLLAGTRRRRAAPGEAEDADIEVVPLRSPSEWEDEAARCYADGDYRGAIRAWFRAATTTLVERGVIADLAGRTALEMRSDVARRSPPTSAAFDRLTASFEAIWYGGRAADRVAVDDAKALVADIRRSSRRPRLRSAPTGERGEEAAPLDSPS